MSQAVLMLFPAAMNFTEPVPGLIALGAAMVAVIVTVGVAGYGVVGALLNAVVVDAEGSRRRSPARVRPVGAQSLGE